MNQDRNPGPLVTYLREKCGVTIVDAVDDVGYRLRPIAEWKTYAKADRRDWHWQELMFDLRTVQLGYQGSARKKIEQQQSGPRRPLGPQKWSRRLTRRLIGLTAALRRRCDSMSQGGCKTGRASCRAKVCQ